MKRKNLLAIPFLSLLTLTACNKDELVEPDYTAAASTVSNITSVESGRRNLLVEERFETAVSSSFIGGNYGDFYKLQTSKSHSFTTPTSVVRNGNRAARFEMRSADSGVIRAEAIARKSETNRHRWYGLSMYLPSDAWANNTTSSGWDIITQFWSQPDAGEGPRNPPIDLYVSKGRMYLKVVWASRAIHTDATKDGEKTYDLGPVEKDKWLDFVYHINFSYKSDGVLEVWKNGVKVVDHRGPNSYNDQTVPYFKYGIYKRTWENISKRVIYVDEVRVGNENATYNDVAPSRTTSSITSSTSSTTSALNLINAGGGQFTDSQSRGWSADANYSGGLTARKSLAIANTTDDALYSSYRFASNGAAMNYNVPVKEAGNYTVKLHFVEPYFKASNSRVFNVNLEGQRVLTNYDIYNESGFARAVVKTYNVSVSDGVLNINFGSVKNNAIVSAIEIQKQ